MCATLQTLLKSVTASLRHLDPYVTEVCKLKIIVKVYVCSLSSPLPFQALLNTTSHAGLAASKPRLPVRVKVIQALIRCPGMVVNVRTLVKNIRDKATEIIKGELFIFEVTEN